MVHSLLTNAYPDIAIPPSLCDPNDYDSLAGVVSLQGFAVGHEAYELAKCFARFMVMWELDPDGVLASARSQTAK